jgi:hypothetical protein
MNCDEGIYLIHTREFISTNVPIYKIGRSNYLDNRVKQYPNGSKILLMIACKNSKSCENNLKNLFKSKFIQKPYYGIEYFEGNYIDMIKEICDYINNINVLITEEIEKMSDVKSEIVEVLPDVVEVLPEVVEVLPEVVNAINLINNNDDINNIINKNDKVCDRTCTKCKTKFRYPSTLKTHLESSSRCSISQEEIKLFFLKVQPIVQPTVQPIVQPIIQQNIEIKNIKTNNNNVCKICNNLYSRKDSLERHLQNSLCFKFKDIKI